MLAWIAAHKAHVIITKQAYPCNRHVKRIQDRFMEALANAIGLRVPYFGFRLFNFNQRKIELIVIRFLPALIISSPIS